MTTVIGVLFMNISCQLVLHRNRFRRERVTSSTVVFNIEPTEPRQIVPGIEKRDAPLLRFACNCEQVVQIFLASLTVKHRLLTQDGDGGE